jgi:hypothetical protein
MDNKTRQGLYDELKQLEQELSDRKAALPAHSVRPSQLMEIEELEDRIKEIKEELKRKGEAD